jgi:NAD(P)-dependent dehydrogenase (short-subunit alcohol dehydrogenase family)
MAAEAQTLRGRYTLVTGGGQGVGAETAKLFAERGAAGVAICGRDRSKLERTARELEKLGAKSFVFPLDLANVEQCFAFVDEAGSAFGRIDTLVNAAGTTDRGSIDNTDLASWELQFAVNARAPFFLMQRVLPWMRKAGGGTIVNVISIVSHGGPPFLTTYCAAKGALAVITKNVANSVAADRIRVNGLNMGWTNTPQETRIQTEFHKKPADWLAEAARQQPFGRLLEPIEIARAIAFLASDESGLMTGSIVDFDQHVIGT